MAPNYAIATRYGRQAQLETFLLSNIVPQRSQLNQQTWADLEAFIANTLAPRLGGVWVLVGPVHGSERPRLNGKAVIPEAFYCIVVDQTPEGDLRAMAVIIGQEESGKLNLERFLATIREVERLTDLDFFPALPDDVEQQLETTRAEPDMCR
jgi:endonuclease G